MSDFYGLKATSLQGEEIDMGNYKDKVVLIVNTASKCGFTYQYEGLQQLHSKYKDQGLVILGFPCNQFGQQEKGNSDEISEFCQLNYGVDFQMFEKVDVNGVSEHLIYSYLKQQKSGFLGSKNIKWNFTKFLINKQGQVVKRFGSTTKPEKLDSTIAKLI